MLDFGNRLGLFDDPKAKAFLFETLLKQRGRFTSCKKDGLIRVFLESGADTRGMVPAEILADDPGAGALEKTGEGQGTVRHAAVDNLELIVDDVKL
jgi:hypothetical protein